MRLQSSLKSYKDKKSVIRVFRRGKAFLIPIDPRKIKEKVRQR